VEARLVLQFLQTGNQLGAVHLDNVTFGVTSPPLPADFDNDGDVDGNDLAVWTASYGIDGGADADDDGDTDGRDFLIWQQSFSSSQLAAVAQYSVPEPGSFTLTWMAGVALRLLTHSARDAVRE
jgi:hypothetical protein